MVTKTRNFTGVNQEAAETRRDFGARDSDLPLVAIATPVYNGARYLAETMECVQSQTYPNLVHCVVDNASTDETAQILVSFEDRRVPLIKTRNAETIPVLDNLNAVVRLVPPEAAYFRLLPASDLMLPQAIDKMVRLGEQHPAVGVIGCQEYINGKVVWSGLPTDREVFPGKAIVRQSLLEVIRGFPHIHCLFRNSPDTPRAKFYATEFHGERLLATDIDAVMRTLSRSEYGCVHEPLAVTRVHSDSVSSINAVDFIQLWSDLQLIDSWGPLVFESKAEFQRCRARHLRFYYRYLLRWRAKGKSQLVQKHMDWLRKASAAPNLVDLGVAVGELPLVRARKVVKRLTIQLGIVSWFSHDL
jgi:glycosyltransferase involved in cell wall biosynthesis